MRVSNTREKGILQFLLKHRERYVTSKELAEYLSCSDLRKYNKCHENKKQAPVFYKKICNAAYR